MEKIKLLIVDDEELIREGLKLMLSIYDDVSPNETDMEKRLQGLLQQMQGVGVVHTMITYRDDKQVEGIVIIADGGGDAVVVRNITEVVRALFDVDSHKIKVIEKKQNQ